MNTICSQSDKIIFLYYQLKSCRAVAEALNVSAESVRRVLKDKGVSRTGWKPHSKKTPKYHCPAHLNCSDQEVIETYLKEGSQIATAQILNISKTSVYRILKRNGIKADGRKNNGKGDTQPGRKITDENLKAEINGGLNCTEIAQKYNMSPERVWKRAKKLGLEIHDSGIGGHWLRRAKLYGCKKFDSSITLDGLIKRDLGICQICGTRVNFKDINKGHIGREYPTLDHIIPLIKGGTHTWDNVQLAHMACNAGKCDRLNGGE